MIISHKLGVNILDLFHTHLIVSSKVFQVIFVHLVYNSAFFFGILLLFILVTCSS
jgi:hypothetical protein